VLETVTKEEEKKRKRVGCVQPTPTLARHTGLSGGAPDSVWCARLAGGEPTALGKTQRRTTIIHRTVRWCNGRQRQRSAAQSAGDAWPATTVGWAHRTVRCAPDCPVRQPAPRTNGRTRQIWKEIAHRTATMTVRWCTGLSGAPPDRRQVSLQRLLAALGR
jgi:hypothetical protein